MVHILLIVIYLAFISLGLPDSLLGSAWPSMYPAMGVPVSYAGILSTLISLCTIVSSLQSDRITKRFGSGKVTAVSVAMTAAALWGFSVSGSYWMLCLWAVPYGLGAGSVDAALNNYVALHYESRHMSWLHCMWGVGASVGPYIMGHALTAGYGWNMGYRYISLLQLSLTVILVLSLPLWKKRIHGEESAAVKPLKFSEILRIPGTREIMCAFFGYCALEATAGLWASSYLVLYQGLDAETAASFASLFYVGITAGRGISGFMTLRFNDTQMIRIGEVIILGGILLVLVPLGEVPALAGLVMIGLGCAPVYPCIIHSTPVLFGEDNSQAIIGIQMACAYTGSCIMPPVFGPIANHVSVGLFPVYLLIIFLLMFGMYEKLLRRVTGQ